MDQARIERMEARIAKLPERVKNSLTERLRTHQEDELRLVADVKFHFIQHLGPEEWNKTCGQG